jgi:hypothetical protein
MKRFDTITPAEAVVAAKRSRPTLTAPQVARIFGISKSAVGRMLKDFNRGHCPKRGRKYAGKYTVYPSSSQVLCGTTEGQLRNFQDHLREADFGASSRLINLLDKRNANFTGEISSEFHASRVESSRKRASEPVLLEEIEEMHARPEVREILIALKLRRWSRIAQNPSAYPNCSPSKARRNFLKLLAKYPDLGRRLNLTIASAYPRV